MSVNESYMSVNESYVRVEEKRYDSVQTLPT
jgi:hypothetical protein